MYLYAILYLCLLFSVGECLGVKLKEFPNFYKISFWVIVWSFIFLSTFRWENGTDWKTYYDFFKGLNSATVESWLEPGYTLLSSTNSAFGSYTLHLGCMAVLSIFPIAYRLPQYSVFPFISLFVWFAITLANIFPVRQSIAISFFFYSWTYINNRELKKFLLCILLAATFHYSVIFAFPVYLIWNRVYSKSVLLISVVAFALFSLGSQHLISNVLQSLGGNLFAEKIDFYLSNGETSFGAIYSPREVLFRGIINRGLFFFITLVLLDSLRRKYSYLNGAINLYWYSFILFLTTTPLSVALGRIASFTDMSQLIIVPFIFKLKMTFASKMILLIIIGFYFLIRFRGVINNYYDLYVPYNFSLLR